MQRDSQSWRRRNVKSRCCGCTRPRRTVLCEQSRGRLDGQTATVTIAIPGLGWCSQGICPREEEHGCSRFHIPDSRFENPDSRIQNPDSRTQVPGSLVAEASERPFPQKATGTVGVPSALSDARVHAQGYIDAMCRQNVITRLGRGLIRGSGTVRKRGYEPLDDDDQHQRGQPEHFLLSRTTHKIGWAAWAWAACEGGRAERPLKILWYGMAMWSRDGNLSKELPIRLLGPQLSRLPPNFWPAQCGPRTDNTVRRGWLGSTQPACCAPRRSQVPAYLPRQRKSRLPPTVPRAWRGRRKEEYGTYRNAITHIPCLSNHTRGP
jgi:hypothetical protein